MTFARYLLLRWPVTCGYWLGVGVGLLAGCVPSPQYEGKRAREHAQAEIEASTAADPKLRVIPRLAKYNATMEVRRVDVDGIPCVLVSHYHGVAISCRWHP